MDRDLMVAAGGRLGTRLAHATERIRTVGGGLAKFCKEPPRGVLNSA